MAVVLSSIASIIGEAVYLMKYKLCLEAMYSDSVIIIMGH